MNRRRFFGYCATVAVALGLGVRQADAKRTCFFPGDSNDGASELAKHWYDARRWSNGIPRAGDTVYLSPKSNREYRVVRPMPNMLLESDGVNMLRNI